MVVHKKQKELKKCLEEKGDEEERNQLNYRNSVENTNENNDNINTFEAVSRTDLFFIILASYYFD